MREPVPPQLAAKAIAKNIIKLHKHLYICKRHTDILQKTTCKLHFSNWIRDRRGLGSFLLQQLIKFEED